ncbi:MAG: tRNA (guanosine(37)-N1)-methyltransferase TrmD [Pseudomonadales bacterium]|nr:tRNA (guanosine(37)-N1)-methyltransferase TrmD [Pseudomonadales bacterium]MBL6808493.1 tRNA (guanosine(37)-N1)-methyltransferase TrmD [Pseudomonadales bacterium]
MKNETAGEAFHAVVVTIFPELIEAVAAVGVFGRAVDRGLIQLETINPRRYTDDRHQTVDSKAYGGGPGMVMKVGPLRAALEEARRRCPKAKVVYLSPQGEPFTQGHAEACAELGEVILLAGRYEGIDQRVIERDVDVQWSLGDYVLSGGELPALVVLDAVARLRPGVLGDEGSAEAESFSAGLLDFPHYTRPEEVDGQRVPEVLLSGDHGAIAAWRQAQAEAVTQRQRPDLWARWQEQQQRAEKRKGSIGDGSHE